MNGDTVVHGSTYVLVPGAWQAGWSWRPVARRLRAAGHRAIAVTLPGMCDGDDPTGYRLRDAVDYVAGEVRRLNFDDVFLVAHSWGGYPSTGAAHLLKDRVRKVVYFNAHVPVRGKSLTDENPTDRQELMQRLIDESPTGSIAPALEYIEQELMQGVDRQLQRLVAELQTPQPGRYFLDALDVDAADLGVPTAYIASDSDRALPVPAGEFAGRLGVRPIGVPGTHNSILTHPDEAAAAILAA
ncbi:alpha/beta fold hydrolase [Mycobacterium intracellulare]|uniref:Alpha/beta hydrolase n=1 Tax=Mycobacterium intracellulare subsp. chimaera TaxID=222805 RepID=A0A220YGZ1_MYCIT|nr:alpha/beta hydrolase [Mycobacterium intracellulare]ASL11038.1 putative alpha/beta hydrolase family protein [Mycobacterium intracellulare subsp. chimaera]ASL16933.1 putative alpha/beta hydrolase family protein [Mycobacterium intracellulare subsp. chimaera]ASL22980.1 putative alpha/beta hydrolase family protein [Mycobacterium intracellulare subsp. chimaera]MCF1815302.1 alpha/beta hydrolase [Mycobacterium intracellulare subsp. intracellulare]MDM3929545.1 alpha/beta hydrolase [Mycobacterium int